MRGSITAFLKFPLGKESTFSLQRGGVIATRTNREGSETVRDERLTNSSLMETGAAELSHLPMSE